MDVFADCAKNNASNEKRAQFMFKLADENMDAYVHQIERMIGTLGFGVTANQYTDLSKLQFKLNQNDQIYN